MKNLIFTIVGLMSFIIMANADDRPVAYEKLPEPAKAYIASNFAGESVLLSTKDDELFLPDYYVVLANGVRLEFSNSGQLKQVASHDGISEDLIPVSIREYVSAHYPDAGYLEYEVGRRTYEVKLTNRMELKFNSNFHIMEVDF